MFLLLAFGTQYFIYKKLQEAQVISFIRKIFVLWGSFWFVIHILSFIFEDYFPGRSGEILYAMAMTWVIISLLGFFAFFGVDLITGFKKFTKKKAVFALILTIIGSLWNFTEAYFVQRRDVVIKSSKLPEGIDKLRIVFLTDVHIGGLYSIWHFERLMKIVDETEPDILALTGDIIDGDMSYRKKECEMLLEASRKAKIGAFAVNGNHEYYHFLEEDIIGITKSWGFDLLIDERRETNGIVIIGVDDKPNGWINNMIKQGDENKFVLVLKHRPGVPYDAENKFDLQISGHTHGGQFWPLGYLKNLEAKSVQGLSEKYGGYVYVSNGAGFNGPPMRMFVPPEVTVIDVVKE